MSKQSAKSKGYRHTTKKKPFLTKKELITLIVIVAAIALVIVLFNLFYDDGYLRASDVAPRDVVSYVSREIDSRYVKVATANDLPGFTRSEPDLSVNPRAIYSFTPDEDTDDILYISLSGSYTPAENLTASTRSQLSGLSDSLEFTDTQNIQVQGHDACIYSYTYDYYEAPAEVEETSDTAGAAETPVVQESAEAQEPAETEEAGESDEEEPASNAFRQTLCCNVAVDDYTVCFDIYRGGSDASFYLPADQIEDCILKYADAFTVYEKEKK